mmetsp:Transcript_45177/g.98240  ORF Transcript_45177/g.98240 Transcript_45177/m.98240 type:complete len:89 (+) Transcript_45177:2922-3188(+)
MRARFEPFPFPDGSCIKAVLCGLPSFRTSALADKDSLNAPFTCTLRYLFCFLLLIFLQLITLYPSPHFFFLATTCFLSPHLQRLSPNC